MRRLRPREVKSFAQGSHSWGGVDLGCKHRSVCREAPKVMLYDEHTARMWWNQELNPGDIPGLRRTCGIWVGSADNRNGAFGSHSGQPGPETLRAPGPEKHPDRWSIALVTVTTPLEASDSWWLMGGLEGGKLFSPMMKMMMITTAAAAAANIQRH